MSHNYRSSLYTIISTVEHDHFWFIARNSLITSLVLRCVPKHGATFLDIGCGTGQLLRRLSFFGYTVTGMDVNAKAIMYAQKTCPTATYIHTSLERYTGKKQYDAVGLFDVLEHQRDPVSFLHRAYTLVKRGGYCFVNVPAGQYLWNAVDTASGHVMRYDKKSLISVLQNAGFIKSPVFLSYWNAVLLPVVFAWKVVGRNKKGDEGVALYTKIPPVFINKFFRWVLTAEQCIVQSVGLPFGTSIIAVVQK